MMNFNGSQVASEFLAAFGKSVEELTPAQMMWLIKFSKHVRGRCRSNAALRNYLVSNFPGLTFREVTKQGKYKSYTTLSISSKAAPELVADEGSEDDD